MANEQLNDEITPITKAIVVNIALPEAENNVNSITSDTRSGNISNGTDVNPEQAAERNQLSMNLAIQHRKTEISKRITTNEYEANIVTYGKLVIIEVGGVEYSYTLISGLDNEFLDKTYATLLENLGPEYLGQSLTLEYTLENSTLASISSPLGIALLNHKVGDSVAILFYDEEERTMGFKDATITHIEPSLLLFQDLRDPSK